MQNASGAISPSTRLAVAALAAMMFVPPLLPLGMEPIPSFEAEWIAALLGLVAAVAAFSGGGRRTVPLPAALLFPAAGALLLALQWWAGMTASTAMACLALAYLAWMALLTSLAARVLCDVGIRQAVEWFAWALLLAAVTNSAVALVQWLHPALDSPWILPVMHGRPGGNLGQPNHLAIQMALGTASLAWLRARGRIRESFAWLPAAMLACGLAVTGSRSAWLLAGLSVAGCWWLGRRLDAGAAREARRVVLVVAAFFVLLDLGNGLLHAGGASHSGIVRFETVHHDGEERLQIWRGAWRMFLDAPWFGQGHGHFAERFLAIAPELPAPRPTSMTLHAHNLPLQIAAEYGLAGLALTAAALLIWFVRVSKRPATPERAWALGVAGILAVQSLVEYPLWYAYFLGPFAVALGAAEGHGLEFGLGRAARWVRMGSLAVGAAILSTVVIDYRFLRSFDDVSRPAQASREAVAHLARMRGFSLLGAYAGVGLHRGIDFGPQWMSEKLALSEEVVVVFPLPDVVYRHALLLAAQGREDDARRWWRRAETSYPSLAARWRKAAGRHAPAVTAGLQQGEDS
ncbi:MAG: O-antigen ligase C-terminal domain-containing protein [Betaproteobacteria bacterium]|nr:O-antigen ligase C-terminal domain-containing protein [Betaproteobacteria bacterium]